MEAGETCRLDAVSCCPVPGARLQVGQPEVLVDLARGRRLVERDEVQARDSLGEQPLAHLARDLKTDRSHSLGIVSKRKQSLREIRWEVITGQEREPFDLTDRCERHDAGNDRNVAASRGNPVTQNEVVVDREEHLRNREVGTRPALAHEVRDVVLDGWRPWVLAGAVSYTHLTLP